MTKNNQEQQRKWPRLLPFIITGLGVLLLSYLLIEAFKRVSYVIAPVFVPLLMSLALAYILEPMVDYLQARKFSRNSAALLTMLTATLVLILAILFIVPSFWVQLSDIVANLPTSARSAASWIHNKLVYVQERNPALYERISVQIREFLQDPSGITTPVVNFIKGGIGQIGNITESVLNLILLPFFVYYILVDFPKLSTGLYSLVPPRSRATVSDLFRQVDVVLRNYVRGQLLVCAGMAVIYVIGFLIVGVPMAITMGILAGLGNLIPYFGTAAAGLLVVSFTVLDNPELWRVLAVIAIFPIVQMIEGFVLTPRILGDKLELHPFVLLVGIILFSNLFGVLGIVLAAPVLASAKVFILFLYRQYLESDYYLRSDGVIVVPATTPEPPSPISQPAPEPAPEPVLDPVPEPIPEPAAEPVAESTPEPTPEPIPEPAPESSLVRD